MFVASNLSKETLILNIFFFLSNFTGEMLGCNWKDAIGRYSIGLKSHIENVGFIRSSNLIARYQVQVWTLESHTGRINL